jgi:hypothetical protein
VLSQIQRSEKRVKLYSGERRWIDHSFPLIFFPEFHCLTLIEPMNAWRRRMFHDCDNVERRLRNLLDCLQSNADDPNWLSHRQRISLVSRDRWIPPVVHARSLPISDEASTDPF